MCPRCGRRFGCGVDSGSCWCAAAELDAAARERLAAAYEGCLCPDCLGGSEPRAERVDRSAAQSQLDVQMRP
jgi:Cysteine-rich CWC